MKYRKMGQRIKEEVSALGFGLMRLPTLGAPDKIDYEQAEQMVNYALDHGVNYFDTAYPYHKGASEVFTGHMFGGKNRKKAYLASKMPVWLAEDQNDFERLFKEQLERLNTDYIDFYLLHALGSDRWKKIYDLGVLDWVEQKIGEGAIRHIGFSFHDEADAFTEIIDAWDSWDFCQIQYNYMDETVQAGTKGLEYAASKGIGVVVMEPLLGGGLVNPPEEISKIWQDAPKSRTAVQWALDWLWNRPEVGTVLSGMSTPEHVIENVKYADTSRIGVMTQGELETVALVRDTYDKIRPVPCTQCQYCMPCPNGVDIPGNFKIYNSASIYNQQKTGIWQYNNMNEEKRASACIACGECLDKCPQKIEIIDRLGEVDKAFAG